MTYYTVFNSPIGHLLLTSDGKNLTRLFMEDHVGGPTVNADFHKENKHPRFGNLPRPDWERSDDEPVLRRSAKQVHEFFAGKRNDFDLPLKPEGSEFQIAVWKELTRIPFGKTISYGELAKRIGKPDAPRAVGLANGKNPIAVIIPCHRVIGASGKLTGYGGGLDRKVFLLEHEASVAGERQLSLI